MSDFFGNTPPKTSFLFGLVTGIAVAAVVGFVLVAQKGTNLGAPRTRGTVATSPTPAPSPVPPPRPAEKIDLATIITKDDHIRGNVNAPVTLVEFSDLECPFCGRFHPTMQQAMTEYGDRVRWIYKHFPLESIHPSARALAEASECAGEQGKFWEFIDANFERQDEYAGNRQYDPAFAEKLAKDLKLNVGKFKSCVDSDKYEKLIDEHTQQGLKSGVQGTPHTLVNGTQIGGAVPYAQLKALIEAELK